MQFLHLFKNKQTQLDFLYQNFFNLSPTPAILCAHETFQLLHTNEATCAFYGYEPAELLKMTLRQLQDTSTSLSPHAATQTATRIRHKKKDGSLVMVQQTRHDLIDQDTHYHLFIMQNIDAEAKMTAQLKNTQETKEQTLSYLESLLQHAPFAFAFLDSNLCFIQVNTRFATLTGKKSQDYIGQSIKQSARFCEAFEPHLKHALSTARPSALFDCPIQFQATPTSTSTTTHFTYGTAYCLPILNSEKKVTGVTLLLADTSEKNKALLHLKESVEANEHWTKLIHQDFKLPLSVARFNAEVIEKKKPPIEQIPSIGKKITESIDRIYQMIELNNTERSISSPLLARQSFKQQNTPVHSLMTSILHEMNHLHGNRFTLQSPLNSLSDKTIAFWSPEYIKQAIETLMSHATSYSPIDSPIQVAVYPDTTDSKWIHVSVQNQGSSLTEQDQASLSESNTEASANSQNQFGLNFVKTIADSHGGKLTYQHSPATGTTITLSLPKL